MSNQAGNTTSIGTLDASTGSHNATGSSQFPAARVKRIIKEDRDIVTCSADAVFLISIATVSSRAIPIIIWIRPCSIIVRLLILCCITIIRRLLGTISSAYGQVFYQLRT
jgi:hypothetical protein